MESSVRWGLCLLSSLLLQVGCCSISVDYGPSHVGAGRMALIQDDCGSPSDCGDPCSCGETSGSCTSGECGINGMHVVKHHLKQRMAMLHGNIACSGGCGEIYWDEQVNEPPVCDPCGCNGEWTGANCGTCRPWYARMRDLWGYRYEPSACSDCGTIGTPVISGSCSSCQSHTSSTITQESVRGATNSPSSSRSSPDYGVPTPAKPKASGEALPIEPSSEKSSGSYRSEPKVLGSGVEKVAKRPAVRADSNVVVSESHRHIEPVKKGKATPVSGRQRLTTQSR